MAAQPESAKGLPAQWNSVSPVNVTRMTMGKAALHRIAASGTICERSRPGGLKDKVAVSGAVDTGSIPVRDAIDTLEPH